LEKVVSLYLKLCLNFSPIEKKIRFFIFYANLVGGMYSISLLLGLSVDFAM